MTIAPPGRSARTVDDVGVSSQDDCTPLTLCIIPNSQTSGTPDISPNVGTDSKKDILGQSGRHLRATRTPPRPVDAKQDQDEVPSD